MVLVTKQKRRSKPISHKRRHGHHHKKDERYLKPYWPYIPMVLVVVIGLVFSNMWGLAQRHVLGYATEMSHSGLLAGTNSQRAAHGLGSLAINSQLNSAAQAKANDMVARDYWSHLTPDGEQPWVFFNAAGYDYLTAGENLAYGFANSDATVTAWMNSPPHKANVLGSNYKEVGFGFANASNFQGTGEQTIIVAMYGSRNEVVAPLAASAPVEPKPQEAAPPAAQASQPVAEAPAGQKPTEEEKPEEKQETNATTANSAATPATTKPAEAQSVTRLQLVAGSEATWSVFVVTTLAVVCLVIFILRHGLFWHRMLVKSERFVIHHKALDIALVAIVVVGIVLTRSAGVIH